MNLTNEKADIMLLNLNKVIQNSESPRISPNFVIKQMKYESSKRNVLDIRGSAFSARPPRVLKLATKPR